MYSVRDCAVFRELSGAVSPVTFSAMSAQMYALKPWRPRVSLWNTPSSTACDGSCPIAARNIPVRCSSVGFTNPPEETVSASSEMRFSSWAE